MGDRPTRRVVTVKGGTPVTISQRYTNGRTPFPSELPSLPSESYSSVFYYCILPLCRLLPLSVAPISVSDSPSLADAPRRERSAALFRRVRAEFQSAGRRFAHTKTGAYRVLTGVAGRYRVLPIGEAP